MTPPLAIQTHNLQRKYHSTGHEVWALRGVTLNIPAGQFVALKGRSGSGKTTLLNCLGGLDQPTAGSLSVLGFNPAGQTDHTLTQWRRQKVGFIFQAFGLLPTLSAYENVELILRLAQWPARSRPGRAKECLELVGLGSRLHHRPYELSGGQQQRMAIARAIAPRPPLILADEATGELDTETTHHILTLFQTLTRQEGLTLLMATHDPLVNEYVDQLVNLHDGQLDI